MPFTNPFFGVTIDDNPLIQSPFIQHWSEGNDTPPPGSEFRITDNSERRITDDGNNRITD